jgi:hypothetical protein
MRKLLMMAMVIGGGALGFAARPDTAQKTSRIESTVVTKYMVPGCRIEKTLKYDFNGNPYLKKVRICA